jgi:hypothetical protein
MIRVPTVPKLVIIAELELPTKFVKAMHDVLRRGASIFRCQDAELHPPRFEAHEICAHRVCVLAGNHNETCIPDGTGIAIKWSAFSRHLLVLGLNLTEKFLNFRHRPDYWDASESTV